MMVNSWDGVYKFCPSCCVEVFVEVDDDECECGCPLIPIPGGNDEEDLSYVDDLPF